MAVLLGAAALVGLVRVPTATGTTPSYADTVAADSPVGYWRLGEASGSTAADASGNNHPATYMNSPTLGVSGALAGDANTAITLAAASHQYVKSTTFNTPTSAFSYELWYKGTSLSDNGLMAQWGSSYTGPLIYAPGGNNLRLYINGNHLDWGGGGANLIDGTWHHVVTTWDGTDGRIYVDGALVAGPTALAGPLTLSGTFKIGQYANPSGTYMSGSLDDAAVYDHALSSIQVATHYAVGRNVPIGVIDTPATNRPLAGDVTVTGTATDPSDFHSYTLDYGAGTSPSSWTTITTASQAVTAGTLGTWSTGSLAAGPYTLRLTVHDDAGTGPTVVTRLVYVDNSRRGDDAFTTRVPFDLGGGWALGVGVEHGDALLSRTLFSLPSYGPGESLSLAQTSVDSTSGAFGRGWISNLTQYLAFDSQFVIWHREDGGEVPFGSVGGTWTALAGHPESLAEGTGSDAGRYVVTLKDQTRLIFEGTGSGRLLRIDNRFGKSLTITWGSGTATVADGTGRVTTLTFTGSKITSVTDGAGRTWTFAYTSSDLTSITEPDPDAGGPLAAPVTSLAYSSHQVTTITRTRRTAAGGADTIVWTLGYTGGKVTSVIDPIAHASHGDVANTFTYNAGSTVVALLRTYDPTRDETTYAFDALGRVTTITDPLNHQTTQAWNADSTLQYVDAPNGASTTRTSYTYTGDGRGNVATETTDANGANPIVTRYVYDDSNDVVETHVADGSADEVVTTDTYDTDGVGNAPGHLVAVTQNASGADPAVTRYAYTANDEVAAELDPTGITTTHAYDADGNETQTVANCTNSGTTPPDDPDWKTCAASGTHNATTNVTRTAAYTLTSAAGKLGLPDSTTDGTGAATTFAYDALGRTTSEAPPEGTTTHAWDQLGNELVTTRPGSLTTTRTYDLANRVSHEVAPGLTTDTVYDAAGAETSRTVAGDTVASTYDGAGNLVSVTVDPGSAPHLALTTEHAYDTANREVATRDPAGTVTRTWYDAQGRVTKVVENCTNSGTTVPSGDDWKTCAGTGTTDATWNLATTTAYDDRGNKVSETAPNGRVTTDAYDEFDRLVVEVDNSVANPTLPTDNVTTEYAYDANGNQTAIWLPTNDGGHTITRTIRDNLGRATSTIANCTNSGTTPPGNLDWTTCTGQGTANASTNVVTTYTYDAEGRQLAVTGPDPSATTGTSTATVTTRYAYDDAGRLCRVLEHASVDLQGLADPCSTAVNGTATANVSTRYTYDAAGRLASMVDANGHTTAYGYDARGRMTSLTDALSAALAWGYDDGANTKTQTNRTDATPLTPTITWTYDAAGRTISRAYLDDAGGNRTTTYTYDAAGGLASAADGGSSISVTNDRLERPTSVTVSGDAGATTTYGYSFSAPTRSDASGSYTMAVDPFGRVTSLTDPIHANPFTWTYGADGQPSAAAAPNGNSTALTYDPLGRLLTTVTGTRASYTYTYNRAGNRLTEASTITGDPANGTATFGYDPLDRLTSYDLPTLRTITDNWQAVPNRDSITIDGNQSSQGFSAANRPNTNSYSFDADGRMTARPGASGGYLEWDSLGRLIRVRESQGGTIVAQYTYDALDRLLTVERSGTRIRFRYQGASMSVAQVVDDIGGSVIRNVAVGPEGTVLEDWLTTSRRIHGTNAHHDTTWTADDTGAVTATVRYDPWGNAIRTSGTLPDWRFQGSWYDTSTDLSWAVARWYSPTLGMFISEDSLLGRIESPAGRQLLAYGEGDPANSWDPFGHLVRRTYRYHPLKETASGTTWAYVTAKLTYPTIQWTFPPGSLLPIPIYYAAYSQFSAKVVYSHLKGWTLYHSYWWKSAVGGSVEVMFNSTVSVHFRNGHTVESDRVSDSTWGGQAGCDACTYRERHLASPYGIGNWRINVIDISVVTAYQPAGYEQPFGVGGWDDEFTIPGAVCE